MYDCFGHNVKLILIFFLASQNWVCFSTVNLTWSDHIKKVILMTNFIFFK